jgi:hypothetical protein
MAERTKTMGLDGFGKEKIMFNIQLNIRPQT